MQSVSPSISSPKDSQKPSQSGVSRQHCRDAIDSLVQNLTVLAVDRHSLKNRCVNGEELDKTVIRSSERWQGRTSVGIFYMSIEKVKGLLFPGGAVEQEIWLKSPDKNLNESGHFA